MLGWAQGPGPKGPVVVLVVVSSSNISSTLLSLKVAPFSIGILSRLDSNAPHLDG